MRKNPKNPHNLLYGNIAVNDDDNFSFGDLIRSVIIMIDFISKEKSKITSSYFLMIHNLRKAED